MTKLTLTIVAGNDGDAHHLVMSMFNMLGMEDIGLPSSTDTPLKEGPAAYSISRDYGNATCDVVHFTPATPEEPDITRLARKFTLHVLAYFDSEDDFNEVNRRNRAEPDPDICHTHDFCDANILMSNAWEDLFPAEPFCPQNPLHGTLWSAAWQKARTAEFDLQRLPLPA
jgi:hypothetical protein